MHGGLILDNFNKIMRDFILDPQLIYRPAIQKDYVRFDFNFNR